MLFGLKKKKFLANFQIDVSPMFTVEAELGDELPLAVPGCIGARNSLNHFSFASRENYVYHYDGI